MGSGSLCLSFDRTGVSKEKGGHSASDRVINHPGEFDHNHETQIHDVILAIAQQCPDVKPKFE